MSPPAQAQPATDRTLLFFALALQQHSLPGDLLIQALNAWSRDRARTLGDILVERGALSRDDQAELEAQVGKHLELHHGDAEKCLEAIRQAGPVRLLDLGPVTDPEVRARLSRWDREFPPTEYQDTTPIEPALPRPQATEDRLPA